MTRPVQPDTPSGQWTSWAPDAADALTDPRCGYQPPGRPGCPALPTHTAELEPLPGDEQGPRLFACAAHVGQARALGDQLAGLWPLLGGRP